MRLINVSRINNEYLIQAMLSVKNFGINFFSHTKYYLKEVKDNRWYEAKTGNKVSEFEQTKLNKWLRDHQKFIKKNNFIIKYNSVHLFVVY